VATLKTWTALLPAGTAESQKQWLDGLTEPAVAKAILLALWAAGIFEVRLPHSSEMTGSVLTHDRYAPTPEWLAQLLESNPAAEASRVVKAVQEVQPLVTELAKEVAEREALFIHAPHLERAEEKQARSAAAASARAAGSDAESADESPSSTQGHQRVDAARVAGAVPVMPHETTHKAKGAPRKQVFLRAAVRLPAKSGSQLVKERMFTSMLDNGATITLLSTDALDELPSGTMCPLQPGDYNTVELADGTSNIRIKGKAYLMLRFGTALMQVCAYVVPLPVDMILGADFLGMFESEISYR
jgi:hypothetical protein